MTFKELLHDLNESFYYKDDKMFCKEDTLAKDLVISIHLELFDGMLPNDWVYKKTGLIVSTLVYDLDYDDDISVLRDNIGEIADNLVDVYNYDLLDWNKTFYYKVDEAHDEFGSERQDMVKQIALGQYYTLDQMTNFIIDFIESKVE